MKLDNLINNVLESNGGLNTYVPQVRDKIIRELTGAMCDDGGYGNMLESTDCIDVQPELAIADEQVVKTQKTNQVSIKQKTHELPKSKSTVKKPKSNTFTKSTKKQQVKTRVNA